MVKFEKTQSTLAPLLLAAALLVDGCAGAKAPPAETVAVEKPVLGPVFYNTAFAQSRGINDTILGVRTGFYADSARKAEQQTLKNKIGLNP